MACTWFGEIPSCCSLTLLLGPAWVLLKYVLQTIFSGPVVFQLIPVQLSMVWQIPEFDLADSGLAERGLLDSL